MSCDDTARVLEALNVLRNVPKAAFTAEALLTIQQLQSFIAFDGDTETPRGFGAPPFGNDPRSLTSLLEDPASSFALSVTKKSSLPPLDDQGSSALSSDRQSSSSPFPNTVDSFSPTGIPQASTPPSSHQTPTPSSPDDHQSSLDPPSTVLLVKALDKDEELINAYLSRSENDATKDNLQRMIEDPRVVDLRLDKSKSTPESKLRKGLSQRSLAIEYTHWELGLYESSRVSELLKDLSISRKRNSGHIPEYLENNKHRFKDQKTTNAGIDHGIKLLVFESLLGARGISAILSFKYRRFRELKYEELADLKAVINESTWLKTLAEAKAGWLDGCQRLYDGT